MKTIIKKIIPDFIIRLITGLFYGWRGDYDTWTEAKKRCTGYDYPLILEKVKESALKVKNGEAAFERDSVLFQKEDYSFPLLSGLLWIAARNNGNLNVLDFGGALGSTFFQNRKFLNSLVEVKWNIVEQGRFVKEGQLNFTGETLQFFHSIDDCLNDNNINVILFSSVLQYLEEPYKILSQAIEKKIEYIIIDRTPFIKDADRITIQKVHPKIYNAIYPCWFLNKPRFLNFLSNEYELITEFNALDKANIKSRFLGFIFQRKP